ncbi:MAG: homoserine kinase [Pseudomonadota bacterium]
MPILSEQRGDLVSTPKKRSVTAFAPATVANVGSAFDVLGFAIERPGDTVCATLSDSPGVSIGTISGDHGRLPTDPLLNTASVAVLALIDHLKTTSPNTLNNVGIKLDIAKALPIGSGLGSSSASSVAALVAVNELLGAPFSKQQLVRFAMEGEKLASGAAHADNVAPALLGGFVLIRSNDPLDIIELPVPSDITVVVATPQIELKTSDARKILKQSVPLHTAISQWGNVAALVAGIYRNDAELIGRSIQDKIIEPQRGELIPGYSAVKQAAAAAGALGSSISGAGPSIFALCRKSEHAEAIANAMSKAFQQSAGVGSTTIISAINPNGAIITESIEL